MLRYVTVTRPIGLNRYIICINIGNMNIGNISSSAPGYLFNGKRKHQSHNKQFLNFKLLKTFNLKQAQRKI